MAPSPTTDATADGFTTEVGGRIQRAIQRPLKGLAYLRARDPEVGLTPKACLYRRGSLRLYHYHPAGDEVYRVPVVFVTSLVSKPYILDLAPGQSLIEFMLQQGFDVYMIDWGMPRLADRRLRLEDYVLDFIPDCLERVAQESGEPQVSLLGYCLGGLLALMHCALNQGAQGPLRNLACLTTPVNFHGMRLFKSWTDPRYFDADRLVDTLGNIPPALLYHSFKMLRPVSEAASHLRLWDNLWDEEYVRSHRRFARWAADQVPFPGECFRQTVKDLQQGNKLIQGEFRLDGRVVDLGAVEVPLLHVLAEHDHIVPYEAARELVPAVASEDKQELVLKGGHVSLVAGANAGSRMWPQLATWLAKRSE